jgi:hypothetical protein
MGKPAVAITLSAAERREAQASAERLRRQMKEKKNGQGPSHANR